MTTPKKVFIGLHGNCYLEGGITGGHSLEEGGGEEGGVWCRYC